MYNAVEEQFIWKLVFEFPGGQCESVYLRRYADISTIHTWGCARERKARERRSETTYCGAVTARAGDIRAYRNPNGHGFRLEHEPLEGPEGGAHTHVCQEPAAGISM